MLTKKCVHSILWLCLLAVSPIFGQQRTTDFALVGPVENVQSVTIALNVGKTAASGFLDSQNFDSIYWQFDRQRNLIVQENFLDYRGKLGIFDRTIYQINPQNQLEKSETTLIQNDEEPRKIAQRKTYYYLGNRLIRMDEFNAGRNADQYWVTNSVYDAKGLQKKVFWMEDEIFSYTDFTLDHFQHPWQELTYANNGQLTHQKVYENNRLGLPLRIRYGHPQKMNVEKLSYGAKYLAEKQVYDEAGVLIRTEQYGAQGQIEEIHQLNYNTRQTDVYRFEFQKDPMNNWIFCEISKNGQPSYVIKRKIKYFK